MSVDSNAKVTKPRVIVRTAPKARRKSALSDDWNERVIAILVPVGLLFAWEVLARVGILDTRFFPAPTSIVGEFWSMITSGELAEHTWISLKRMLIASVIGGVPALIIGLAMGLYRKVRIAVDPLIAATYPIPKSAIFPLLMLIFGLGEASKIAVVAIGVFYPIVVNTAAGVLEIDKVHHDVGKNFGASRWQTFRTIALPGALPLILTGVNLAVGMALMLLAVAEMLGANSGIGYLIWNSWQTFNVEPMYVGLITIAALGVIASFIVKETERRLVPWRADR